MAFVHSLEITDSLTYILSRKDHHSKRTNILLDISCPFEQSGIVFKFTEKGSGISLIWVSFFIAGERMMSINVMSSPNKMIPKT